ncbi:MAG: SMC-Scp complex subunit ScpB [Gammaproteobacteria bacterium]
MESQQLKNIVEAALLAAGSPVTVDQLRALFGDQSAPEKQEIRAVIMELQEDYAGRGIEVREVASGFRIQVIDSMSPWLSKLWEERPPRYSRALMETLVIIAYRQPVTRGDIEEIRGVSVTSNIIRTLLEREWIKVLGHRDVPGKPAMFGTTRGFLDYFNLKKLDDLPPLAELAQLEPMAVQLDLDPEELAALETKGSAEGGKALETADVEGQVTTESSADEEANDEQVNDQQSNEEIQDETSVGEEQVDDEGGAEPPVMLDESGEPIGDFSDSDEDFDEDDEELSDEELEAAQAKIDAINAELTNYKEKDEWADIDVPPGGVQPLVGLNAPGEEVPEPATVASLDEARAAATEQQESSADEEPENIGPAEVVPLKS